jgi:hypothetical protein
MKSVEFGRVDRRLAAGGQTAMSKPQFGVNYDRPFVMFDRLGKTPKLA